MIIIGLGNPGKEYDGTRHNFGFAALDAFWEKYADAYGLSDWKKNGKALVARSKKLTLVKSQTFMNKSGEAVRPYYQPIKKYVVPPKKSVILTPSRVEGEGTHLVVVHDDLDLPLGTIRVSVNKSSAGHKGVQSIIDHLGTQDFVRIRIGIDVPNVRRQQYGGDAAYVLSRFGPRRKGELQKIFLRAANVIHIMLQDGIEKAANFTHANAKI